VDQKLRHRFSILAAGGIRSAADAQKTVQRGANGIKIDWPVLLTADPMARQRHLKKEKIHISYDEPALAKRIANLIRVWNIQITECWGLPASKTSRKRLEKKTVS
jgi:glutamate synthase domain-containing protein 2